MRMRSILAVIVLAGCAVAVAPTAGAGRRTSRIVSWALMPEVGMFPEAASRAETGETIHIAGAGIFHTGAPWHVGGGTFVHRNAEGRQVSAGWWAPTRTLSFESYGAPTREQLTAGEKAMGMPPPPGSGGGKLVMRTLLVDSRTGRSAPATMTIFCGFGDSPEGTHDGALVDVKTKGGLHFDEILAGSADFIGGS